jgi:hypothetical protein
MTDVGNAPGDSLESIVVFPLASMIFAPHGAATLPFAPLPALDYQRVFSSALTAAGGDQLFS